MPEGQREALKRPYFKDRFDYDEATDSSTCPEGQRLPFRSLHQHKGTGFIRVYRATGAVCRVCPAFGLCTKDRRWGRTLWIGPHDALLRRHRDWMATEEAQALYTRRKQLPEPAFGILKEQMGARRFLLRGLANVRSEFILLATAFNLRSLWRIWAGCLPRGSPQRLEATPTPVWTGRRPTLVRRRRFSIWTETGLPRQQMSSSPPLAGFLGQPGESNPPSSLARTDIEEPE